MHLLTSAEADGVSSITNSNVTPVSCSSLGCAIEDKDSPSARSVS